MGLLNLFRNKQKSESVINPSTRSSIDKTENFTESDDELPWGWTNKNKEFTDKIENEYSYFLNVWLNARNQSPRELYSALRSFVEYMESVQRLCSSKGKYFEIWCNEILLKPEYLDARKKELDELSTEWMNLQKEYEKNQKLLITLHDDLWNLIVSNDSILQTDIYKHFDNSVKQDIQSLLYNWDNLGKISRIKTGRTYTVSKK